LPAVKRVTGKSRSAIYQEIKDGKFPKPVKLGPRAVGWVEDEIADYNERVIAARDGEVA
jgi:prophage regulatory protein